MKVIVAAHAKRYIWIDQDLDVEYRESESGLEYLNCLGNWTDSRFATVEDLRREASLNNAIVREV
jgi:hypothetical protein